MTSQFSPKVSEILAFSREEATRLASRSVGPEHLLLGIIREKNSVVRDLFSRMKINIQTVKDELEERVRVDDVKEPLNTSELVLNEKASNILKLAVLEARMQHTQTVDVQHLLMAILHDQMNNGAKEVLEFNNVTYEDVVSYLQAPAHKDGLDLPGEDYEEAEDGAQGGREWRSSGGNGKATQTQTQHGGGKTPVLDNFSTDLTKAAMDGKLDPVVGREKEIQRIVEILCRRKKNNPILIGEPGVGKSAIVEGLAQLIAKGKCSPVLFNKRVVNLDMTGIVAGTKYRGQFEERIRALIKELEQNSDIIVFIDEIHTLVGAGSTPGSMDAANIMKPALARGTIQCIGATTLDEYRNSIEKDGALERRFQKVLVEPTTAEETLEILRNIKGRYEDHHHVEYSDEAIDACVKLTERYATDRFFPDKAIDALDEAGSRVHLSSSGTPENILQKEREVAELKQQKNAAAQAQDYEKAANLRDQMAEAEKQLAELVKEWEAEASQSPSVVDEDQVAAVVSIMSGVPVERVTRSEEDRLRGMKDALRSKVIAQDKAIERVVRSITRSRLGLKGAERPIGTFLFVGPTGVGKTHLVKCLAEWMFGSKDALIRMDMSEYGEKYSVSRLVGAPPGYVGYEEGGQLTEKVRRHPYSVVLLDEIEKAHPDVFNTLLQVMDEGRMTDGNGVTADFRNTIIIMTSNSGTRQLKDFGSGVGFNSSHEATAEQAEGIVMKALSKQFAPEFLNRLDDIVMFHPLTADNALEIADLEIRALQKRLDNVPLQLEVTDAARRFLVAKGFDSKYGARSLKRAIHKYLEDNICDYLMELPADQAKPGVLRAEPNEANDNIKLFIP